MNTLFDSSLYRTLGFPPAENVSTLRSIAHLFGSSKCRCGIYLLEFPKGRFYIGQAVDVVRRFGQHRKNYENISGFSFLPTKRSALDQLEQNLIHGAERLKLVLLNTIHMTDVVGDTDLDLVLTPDEQKKWLSSPSRFNGRDSSVPISLPESQLVRFSSQFERYLEQPLADLASKLFRTYVRSCLPAPNRTEYSFWVVSCLPSTNRNTWPRLLCVSAGVMELLVIGYHKNFPSRPWGFVTVASDVLSETFKTTKSFGEAFPSAKMSKRQYRDGGQHQVTLWSDDPDKLIDILGNKAVQRAAATLALRIMRKRATIYSKFHCKQLANLATGKRS